MHFWLFNVFGVFTAPFQLAGWPAGSAAAAGYGSANTSDETTHNVKLIFLKLSYL